MSIMLQFLNIFARALAVGSFLFGVMAILAAVISPDHRIGDILAGLAGFGCGFAFWKVRPLTERDVASFLGRLRKRS